MRLLLFIGVAITTVQNSKEQHIVSMETRVCKPPIFEFLLSKAPLVMRYVCFFSWVSQTP